MIDHVQIVRCEWLAGSKKAVLLDGKIHLSPAMFDLTTNASPEELEHLLRHIELVDMGKFNPLQDFLSVSLDH